MSDDSQSDVENTSESSAEQEPEAKKPSGEILREELREAVRALELSSTRLFFSGLAAGLEIGFSLFLMGVMYTLFKDEFPPSVVQLLVANMYSFGFILVILGRSELFTEQTSLAVLPVLNGQASGKALARLWGIIYVANLLGAFLSAALFAQIGPVLGVIHPEAFSHFAETMVKHPAQGILLSAVLAGWLMGLLSWLVAAGRETISQIAIVWLITAAIGLGHLHHSILGAVEVLAGVFTSPRITLGDFGYFLFWTTLGNAVGGPVFLALLKFAHARPHKSLRMSAPPERWE